MLSKSFNSSLKSHIPECPDPCGPSSAANFEKLLKSYSEDEIKKVISYAHTGWWARTVHSPTSLHKNFSKILAAMRREDTVNSNIIRIDRSQRNKDGSLIDTHMENLF